MDQPRRKWEQIAAEKRASSPAMEATESKPKKGRIVDYKIVNVRKEPSKDSEAIHIASEGEEYEILSVGERFTKINVPGKGEGYVVSKYIKPMI